MALHRCPAPQRVPVPQEGEPVHTFGMSTPHGTDAGVVAGQRGAHSQAPMVLQR